MTLPTYLQLTEALVVGLTSSAADLGGSPSFDAVPFHVRPGRDLPIGAWVAIESDDPCRWHYGWVVEGQEDNPRTDPRRLQQTAAYQVGESVPRPGDSAPHVTRILKADVRGELVLDDHGTLRVIDPQKGSSR